MPGAVPLPSGKTGHTQNVFLPLPLYIPGQAGGRGCRVSSLLLKVCAVLLVLVGLCFGAYRLGYGMAETEGLAALRLVQVEREEERRAAAEAYGTALADTLARYQKEVAAAEKVATTLANENSTLEAQAQTLRRQIKNATAGSTHVFSADFVRLWNNFTGAVTAAASAVPGPSGAGGVAGAGSAGAAAGAGVPGVKTTGSGAPLGGAGVRASGDLLPAQTDPREGVPARTAGRPESVTEEDVLEFMAYYGSRCQRLEGKERAWQALAKGWVQ